MAWSVSWVWSDWVVTCGSVVFVGVEAGGEMGLWGLGFWIWEFDFLGDLGCCWSCSSVMITIDDGFVRFLELWDYIELHQIVTLRSCWRGW